MFIGIFFQIIVEKLQRYSWCKLPTIILHNSYNNSKLYIYWKRNSHWLLLMSDLKVLNTVEQEKKISSLHRMIWTTSKRNQAVNRIQKVTTRTASTVNALYVIDNVKILTSECVQWLNKLLIIVILIYQASMNAQARGIYYLFTANIESCWN